MRTKHIMVTGVLGWLGGMATALVGASCDLTGDCPEIPQATAMLKIVDSSSTAVRPMTADSVTYTIRESSQLDREDVSAPGETFEARCLDAECTTWATGVHNPGVYDIQVEACGKTYNERVEIMPNPETCHIVQEVFTIGVDGRLCDGSADQQADADLRDRDPECDMAHHPSVYVQVIKNDGNMAMVANVDRVWFEHEGNRMDALCVQGLTSDKCVGWIAGQELTGEFKIFTEYCDALLEKDVTVQMREDGCHPETEYLVLEADTTACLKNATDKPPPPPDPI